MRSLEKTILLFCQEKCLFGQGDHLVVGVSGGADSMALLHLLARLAPDLGITMVVAHADHGLRPEAAAAEATMVRQASAALGLDCHVNSLDVAGHAKKHGLSIEEAARDLRYLFFGELASTAGANKIAVAHTADDQAEEILLRLIRGAGRKGLSGMTSLRDGRVVRPLLETPKNQILSYLKDRKVSFAIDASNADRRYLRNRIRLDLLPYLANFNPSISQTLRHTAAILQDEDIFLDAMVQDQYRRMVSENNPAELPFASVNRSELRGLSIAIARRVLEKMLIHVGAQVKYRHVESLMKLASKDSGQIHLRNGLRATTSPTELRLFYPWGKKSCRAPLVDNGPSFSLCIEGPGRYQIAEIGIELLVETLSPGPNLDFLKNDPADYFDAVKTPFPLTVRNRRPNDRLFVMGGTSRRAKKVSAILSGKKIPRQQRHAIPIAACGDQVVAILSLSVDDRVKVTDSTTALLKVSIRAV